MRDERRRGGEEERNGRILRYEIGDMTMRGISAHKGA